MPDDNISETRPKISEIKSGKELKRWYWRKDELIAHARSVGIKTTSGKFIILERIAHFLDTGDIVYPENKAKPAQSKFNWHTEKLSKTTVITDSYKTPRMSGGSLRRPWATTSNSTLLSWIG